MLPGWFLRIIDICQAKISKQQQIHDIYRELLCCHVSFAFWYLSSAIYRPFCYETFWARYLVFLFTAIHEL